jgi:hypothetical protein
MAYPAPHDFHQQREAALIREKGFEIPLHPFVWN